MLRKMLRVISLIILIALVAAFYFVLLPALRIGTGYSAKVMASAVFVSGRTPEHVLSQELKFLPFLQCRVDEADKSVTATMLGLAPAKAIFRPGLGATLVHGSEAAIRAQPLPQPMLPPAEYATLPWPQGNAPGLSAPGEGVKLPAVQSAIDAAFGDAPILTGTRAVVVILDGKLIAERYAEGFHADMPLAGWSMNKSITNALVGILVRQGRLDIHQPVKVADWGTDERAKITIDHLLRMSTGLAFAEQYFNPFADATRMLFLSPSAFSVASAKAFAHPLDTAWAYSSGTTNILAWVIRQAVGEDYPDFANRELLAPLGMYSAVLEPDASGTYVGSSFGWATARDWARFGQLYLQDGMWSGRRILPEGWVAYSTTPTPAAPMGQYGAHWWLNAGEKENPASRTLPSCPPSVYFASGFEGQRIFVAPTHRAVIVRLGLSADPPDPAWDTFLAGILSALP